MIGSTHAALTAALIAVDNKPGEAFGINVNAALMLFTTVILVLGGIFLGSVMIFRANKAQTSDNARTILNVGMGLFVVVLLVFGGGWFVVQQLAGAFTAGK